MTRIVFSTILARLQKKGTLRAPLLTRRKSEIQGRMGTWEDLRKAFAHAFAVQSGPTAFTAEDLALLEKVATAIIRRGMAAPALLFLESMSPLSFVGGQMLHGLKPFLELVCDAAELERLARIFERRESVDALVACMQKHAPVP